ALRYPSALAVSSELATALCGDLADEPQPASRAAVMAKQVAEHNLNLLIIEYLASELVIKPVQASKFGA
ncbi:MAG: hypothetical protein HY692_06460, partial [Cyanobacteria bacterium NC_groundwater_1444_Ag_S-0.65um_54_12]|nr:hypothetical protein [Cyanobacteria bacterium NC_groundwater_1444_Ag_S-0.65um_54_12]